METTLITVRHATPADSDRIAALHTASWRQLTATRPDLVKGVMLWAQGDGLMGCLMDADRRPIMASVPSAPHTDPATLFAHLDQVRGYLERRAG